VKENISSQTQVKSSVARGIRTKILQQFPSLENDIDEILPKKTPLILSKCPNHISLIAVKDGNQEILFFNDHDGPFYPTLRLLHKFPHMLPHLQVDYGAIKHVIGGANIMCPGLTSPGAKMTDVPEDSIVAIMAERKQHALAIGLTKMSTQQIRDINKGIAVENIHYLNDGLWTCPTLD